MNKLYNKEIFPPKGNPDAKGTWGEFYIDANGEWGEKIIKLDNNCSKVGAKCEAFIANYINGIRAKGVTIIGVIEYPENPSTFTSDTFYLKMKYGGLSLEKKYGKLTFKNMVQLLSHILSALSFLHNNGIFHCDIKDANIVMDLDGCFKLIDFGLAQFHDSRISSYNHKIRKYSRWWRSPQMQFNHSQELVNWSKADLWAVGAVILSQLGFQLNPETIKRYNPDVNWNKLEKDIISQGKDSIHDDLYEYVYLRPEHVQNVMNAVQETLRTKYADEDRIIMFIELLKGLMEFDASERISIDHVLSHPLFNANDDGSPKSVTDI
tara:strand:- start:384 stop:1349 length:966 start_codon:yes stop_codon:yes gene_type:complete